MQGRGSYKCVTSGDKDYVSCAVGPCQKNKKYAHEECPYRLALGEAQMSSIVVHNFDSFYFQTMVGAFKKRKLLLIDEAHNIENKFLNFIEFSINNKDDKSLVIPKYDSIEHYTPFLNKVKKICVDKLKLLKEVSALTQEVFKEEKELENLIRKINIYFASSNTNEFVFEYKTNDLHQTVTFKPVYVGSFIRDRLFVYGDRILLMSATILDKEIYCKSIGLNPENVAFIQIPSYFPVENRPLVLSFAGSMSYKNIKNTLPVMVARVKELLTSHETSRGIIHTTSEYIADYIRENITDDRLTFKTDFRTVDDMLEVHTKKTNSVIVASGLREGLDLYDDLSEFQIILKMPYLSLGDVRVKRRLELSKEWYGYMCSLYFIQSLGRSVRSVTDKAITYILDKDFSRFYGMNKCYIPEYIKDSIISEHIYYGGLE